MMSQRAVDAVFQGLYLFTDLRAILRETAPAHRLDEEQRAAVAKALEKLRKQADILEKELVQ